MRPATAPERRKLHPSPQGPGGAFVLSPIDQQQHAPQHRPSPAPLPAAAGAGAQPPLPGAGEDPPKIKVVVRKRPISRKERERGDEDMVEVSRGGACVIVNETKVKVDLTKYVERHQVRVTCVSACILCCSWEGGGGSGWQECRLAAAPAAVGIAACSSPLERRTLTLPCQPPVQL